MANGVPVIHDMGKPGPKKPHRGDTTIPPKSGTGETHPGNNNPTPKSK